MKNPLIASVLAAAVGLMLAGRVTGQTFTNLHSFTAYEGAGANGLVLGTNTLFGTTQYGTNFSPGGTVFAINTNGTGFTNLYVYSGGSDGYNLNGGLILSSNALFGTAQYGGTTGYGTIFTLNTDGTEFTNIHDFGTGSGDGIFPTAGLLLSGQTLYGTSSSAFDSSYGTVFAINVDGTGFTNLHTFNGTDGWDVSGNLVLSGNTLYGTTFRGGSMGNGTLFAVTTIGTGFTNLYSFTNSDGANPYAGLVLSSNMLYGTATTGGTSGKGTLFRINTDGSAFMKLHDFTGGSEGSYPTDLIVSGNKLYGTTHGVSVGGGTVDRGTVFTININGTNFRTLYCFTAVPPSGPYTNSDGANPIGLILSDNTLYGTATSGGTSGNGTVYCVFVQPQLTIIPSGQYVILTWPTNYAGFNLQSTTNLLSPVWTTNSPSPVVVNGQNTVTNPISGTQQFYRLSQ